jgi:uncharacterized damage-inducible protein DinB
MRSNATIGAIQFARLARMSTDDLGSSNPVSTELLRVARRELAQDFGKIEKAVARLNADQVWARGHETSNSIGNLLLHLAGNVRQWIIGGIGGEEDRRERDAEFDQRDAIPTAMLLLRLGETVREADSVLDAATAVDLLEKRKIQGYDVSGVMAVFHCVAHFSGHTGQILWAVKQATGEDLGFYGYLKGGGVASADKREP